MANANAIFIESTIYTFMQADGGINKFVEMVTRLNSNHLHMKKIIEYVIRDNAVDFMKSLISDFDYDVPADDNYAIKHCSNFNYPEMMILLINNGADIHCPRKQYMSDYLEFSERADDTAHVPDFPVRCAFYSGSFNTFTLLLDYGVDINSAFGEDAPLQLCCHRRLSRNNFLKLFLDRGERRGINQALIVCCAVNGAYTVPVDAASMLIDAGADVFWKNNWPLKSAIIAKNFSIIKLLVQHGAIVDEFNPDVKLSNEKQELYTWIRESDIDPYAFILLWLSKD